MSTEQLPQNEHDMEELLARKLRRGRGFLSKAYDDEDKLINKFFGVEGSEGAWR